VADSVKKLPGDVSHLQRLIGDHATDRGMPPARLQRWLNAMIVTAVLDRVRDEDGCVSLRYQVAQKLHACTEVFDEGRENDRFRDVMDILLVEDLVYDVGLVRVREACVDIFTVRDKHTWPPTLTVYDSWRVPFAELARENGFKPDDIDEAAAALTALIAAIDT
jgi:Nucleotidyl transferase AbiEii toxin, Type IV TA system